MYNMIIADDEQTIRDGLTKFIQTVFPQIHIQKVCKNGQEVVDCIQLGATDILIADINMPIMSGLEVAKLIHNHKLPIHIILITGYAQFEYAKLAIDYRVESFFSKPFDSERMIEVVENVLAQIDESRATVTADAKNYLHNHIRNKNFISLGYSGILTPENTHLHQLFSENYSLSDLFICELRFNFGELQSNEDLQTVLIDLGEFSSDTFESYLVEQHDNSFVFLIVSPREDTSITDQFVSEFKNSFQLFYHSVLEVEPAVFYRFDEWVSRKKTNKILDEYINNLQKKNFALAIDNLKNNLAAKTPDELALIFIELKDHLNQAFSYVSKSDTLASGSSLEDFTALHKEVMVESSKSYDIVLRIKESVNQNYSNSMISLANIARELHMNETYLSRMFKEKTGERFVDYLIDVRIQNAKKLLATGKYTVNAVARAVGYSQIKHFRTIFKKKTGITASEFISRSVVGGYDL